MRRDRNAIRVERMQIRKVVVCKMVFLWKSMVARRSQKAQTLDKHAGCDAPRKQTQYIQRNQVSDEKSDESSHHHALAECPLNSILNPLGSFSFFFSFSFFVRELLLLELLSLLTDFPASLSALRCALHWSMESAACAVWPSG